MFAAARAVRLTERIYENFASALVLYLFEFIEFIVPVIIEDNEVVWLFKLGIYAVHISYFLAGRGGYLIPRVIFADIFFENFAHNNDLIYAVVSHFQYLVAVFVGKMLFGDERVRESKADRNFQLVKGLDDKFGELWVELTAYASSAVPCRAVKAAENGRYLQSIDEIFGVFAKSFYHQLVKTEMMCKAREMKIYAHFSDSFLGQIYIKRDETFVENAVIRSTFF